MSWYQKSFRLPSYRRGFHLVPHIIEQEMPELSKINVGLAHIFIHHTSAGLTLNENADPTVRIDFESHFNVLVPEMRRTTNTPTKDRTICPLILKPHYWAVR